MLSFNANSTTSKRRTTKGCDESCGGRCSWNERKNETGVESSESRQREAGEEQEKEKLTNVSTEKICTSTYLFATIRWQVEC